MTPFSLPGWGAFFWLPSKVYSVLTRVRGRAYEKGYAETVRMPVPVFCVGNLTVGGSGKTPVTLWLAERLQGLGRRPAVLSRGYGRLSEGLRLVDNGGGPLPTARDIGDEPRLLAERLPG